MIKHILALILLLSLPLKANKTVITLEIQPNKTFSPKTGKQQPIPITPEAIEAAKNTLEARLIKFGILDTSITTKDNLIYIQLPKITHKKAEELKAILTTSAKLTIHKRHPQSDLYAEMVHSGKKVIPGYRGYPQEVTLEDGTKQTRYILVTRTPALTGKDIHSTNPNYSTNTEVFITLTSEGTKKMEAFTRSLTRGQDSIVSILDGKVINSAVLNADVLSKHFAISGLDDLEECKRISNALANPLKNDSEIIDWVTISK